MLRRGKITVVVGAGLLGLLSSARPAVAEETWFLVGEAGAGVAQSEPEPSLNGPGGSGAVAAYQSLGSHALTGLRLRAGAFGAGDVDPAQPDPGMGTLGALTLAARLTPFARPLKGPGLGLWMEVGAGAGLMRSTTLPVMEAGAGLGFRVGSMVLGPSLRYLHGLQRGSGPAGADAKMAFLGLEVAIFDKGKIERMQPPRMALQPIPGDLPPRDTDGDGVMDTQDRCAKTPEDLDQFEDQDGCPDLDNDKDGIADARDQCPLQAEVVNGIDDTDGCPDDASSAAAGPEPAIEVIDDRIVLDEAVLFDSERARVRTSGQRALSVVVMLWKQHPEWERLEIEGHSDLRGPERFNMWLSEERAQRVRATLVGFGVPESKLTAKGFGSSKPRAPGRNNEVHSRNRRVELVVIRKKPGSPAAAAKARPAAEPPPARGPSQPPDLRNLEPVYGRPEGPR